MHEGGVENRNLNYTNDNFPFEIKRNLLTIGWHNQNMLENRNVDSQREFVFYAIVKWVQLLDYVNGCPSICTIKKQIQCRFKFGESEMNKLIFGFV